MAAFKLILLNALICLNAAYAVHGDFKRLLLTDEDYIHNLEGKLQQMTDHIETLISNQHKLQLENTQQQIMVNNLTQTVNDLEQYKISMRSCETGTKSTHYAKHPENEVMNDIIDITFSTPFLKIPVVTVGISELDIGASHNLRVSVTAQSVTLTGFQIKLIDWADSETYSISATWIACPNE